MNRTITYHIEKEAMMLTVAGFLRMRGYSSQNLTDLKRSPGSILVNGELALMKQELTLGDELTVHIVEHEVSEHIPPVQLPLDIVFEDEDLIVINKPAGMPIHTSLHNYENTLANALAYYYQQQNKPFVYRCVNRLDRDTSGLTIVAKHRVSAGILGSMVAAKSGNAYAISGQEAPGKDAVRRLDRGSFSPWEDTPILQREYMAIVRGEVKPEYGTIDAPIARKDGSIIERMVDFEKGEKAITHYEVVRTGNGHSLLKLHLETGRTHQIRVHLKHAGYPLVGDYLYNPDMEWISRQALHSCTLRFMHPMTGEKMEFTAPLPQDMRAVLGEGDEEKK